MLNLIIDLNITSNPSISVAGKLPVPVMHMDMLYAQMELIAAEPLTVTRLFPELIPANRMAVFSAAICELFDTARQSSGNHYVILPFNVNRFLTEHKSLLGQDLEEIVHGESTMKIPRVQLLDSNVGHSSRDMQYYVMAGKTFSQIEPSASGVIFCPTTMLARPWDMCDILTVTSMRALHAVKDDTKKPYVQYIYTTPVGNMVIAHPARYVSKDAAKPYVDGMQGLPGHMHPLLYPWGWWNKE